MKPRTLSATLIGTLAAAGSVPAFAFEPGAGEGVLLVPDRMYDSRTVLAAAQAPGDPLQPGLRTPEGPRNGKLAMLYSLLLPGLGELYLGHQGRAAGFFVAEGAIWSGFAIFRSQGSHRRDLYREFAALHAGVPARDDDDFYRVIGNYVSSDGPFSANEQVRREARLLYPDDREKQDEYFQENAYVQEDGWDWGDEDTLDRYGEMRKASEDAYDRAKLTLGLLVANRLLSVLDVGILASGMNEEGENRSTLFWNLDAGREGPGARVTLARSF